MGHQGTIRLKQTLNGEVVMKTINKKSLLVSLFGSLTLLLTVACNNASTGSGTPTYGYGTYGSGSAGCANCTSGVTLLGNTESYSPVNDAAMQMQFFGTNLAGGPLQVQGTLQVNYAGPSFCGYAPPGQYQVQTGQAGQISGAQIGNLVLVATGPAQITMNVYSGYEMQDGSYYMSFTSTINGYPCYTTLWK
jgi:hypothetical protein